MALVVLKDIVKFYNGRSVCRDINLDINKGEFFTFLGPSGCGKTTLLRVIAGFIRPEQGAVFLNGKDITAWPAEKRKVGMVFQNYALFPYMNVYDNIAYGLKIEKTPKKDEEKRVKKYLELVNLQGYEERNISELSGGEQQRVALARSLVMEPEILLLDEPLSNLDARLRDKMRMELKEIQKKLGITTIFVTHDQTEALTMSDRIAVFNQGNCIQVGTPNEIYLRPINSFVAAFIGDTNLFEGTILNQKVTIGSHVTLLLSEEDEGRYVSIRPQDIQLHKKGTENPNNYIGEIQSIKTHGLLLEYDIKVSDLLFKVITLNSLTDQDPLCVGETVTMMIDPRRIRVLKS